MMCTNAVRISWLSVSGTSSYRFRSVSYTNHLPKVGASDDGTWRRLIVIPFGAKIHGKNDIKNYIDYLVENASPTIMTWIIEGAKKAIDAGFKLRRPKCVMDAINAYREDNDWLGHVPVMPAISNAVSCMKWEKCRSWQSYPKKSL